MFPMFFFGVWALVGVVFLAVALIMRRVNRNKMQRCTRTAAGTVIEVVYHRRHDGERGSYYPVVEYTVGGECFRMRSGVGHNPPQYQGGESVTVHYDPEQPEYFYIGDNGTAHVLEKVFLLVGLVCILAGSLLAYMLA